MEYLAVRRLLLVTNGTDRSWRGRERIDTLEKKTKQDTYSGFGGALAYGCGFRITRSAFGIVAVFGSQNSFCH